jgi:hypothetical protein
MRVEVIDAGKGLSRSGSCLGSFLLRDETKPTLDLMCKG